MDQNGLLRLGIFAVILVVMALWESLVPYRSMQGKRRPLRWLTNFGLLILGAALTRFTVGAAMIATAVLAQDRGWGILHLIDMPGIVAGLIAVVGLDCAVYWQHRLTHIVPLLWRFHRVHHCDVEFDVSTAVRFHPFEILASAVYKSCFVVAAGGGPVGGADISKPAVGLCAFNHGNVHLPRGFDRVLRMVIVTPDMHRCIIQA